MGMSFRPLPDILDFEGDLFDKNGKLIGRAEIHRRPPDEKPNARQTKKETCESLGSGPGTELCKLLDRDFPANCPCKDLIRKMNQWGVDGCQQNRDWLIDQLMDSAGKHGKAWEKALARVLPGISRHHVGKLIDKAITIVEERSTQRIAIVTTCKGRLDNLKLALPSWLNQQTDIPYEIVVVDYSDPDGAAQWANDYPDERVRGVQADNHSGLFNLAHARNVGASQAKGDTLFFLDAETILAPIAMQIAVDALSQQGVTFVRYCPVNAGGAGWCMVRKKLWRELRGFDENCTHGWGSEDIDFQQRCRALGKDVKLDPTLVLDIPHDDSLRVKYYSEKDKHRSNRLIRQYITNRKGKVNPQGFGEPTGPTSPVHKRLVLGMGTGRCGTTSFAELMNNQPNVKAWHEPKPLLPWDVDSRDAQNVTQRMRKLMSLTDQPIVCESSFWLLPYLRRLIHDFPDLKAVVLQRDKQQTIDSYVQKMAQKKVQPVDHWKKNREGLKPDGWDMCYPKFDVETMEEGIAQFWDEYYGRALQLQIQHPDNVRIFPMEYLSDEYGIRTILSFIGLDNTDMNVRPVHLNKGAV